MRKNLPKNARWLHPGRGAENRQNENAILCVFCFPNSPRGINMPSRVSISSTASRSEGSSMFGFPKWILAGSIGGAIGAAVWAAISYFANAEVGYVAWGIGFIVGFMVRLVAGEKEEGLAPGLTAALIAVVAVLGGKYAGVQLLVN
jgi:hypothetical protein